MGGTVPRARVGEVAAVAALVLVAAALRLWRVDLGWFGVDQARDVATAMGIADGSVWPLTGPTMRRVTRLGALYHYVWALPYLVSRDPLAGYRFAALLGTAAVVVTWRIARRSWGPIAGVVTLAVAATHPVWVIDTRVLWSPAALPLAAAALAVVVLAPGTTHPERWSAGRAVALGALLGVVVQLHLSMLAWVPAVVLATVLDRPRPLAVVAAAAGALATGFPALAAMAAAPAVGDAGVASLATRGGLPDVAGRLAAAALLPERVLGALGGPAGGVLHVATVALACLVAAGLVRLATAALRGERAARVLLVLVMVPLAAVALLPGEAWYYYLDALLPLAALAVGALAAPSGGAWERAAAIRPSLAATVVVLVAAAVAAVHAEAAVRFLRTTAARGYLPVEPAPLTLDGRPGKDAAVAGRVLTAGAKRAVARAAAVVAADYPTLWSRLHGPAFGDATGDNGFWVRHATTGRPATTADARHVGLWHRDDPTAARLGYAARPDTEVTTVGPLVLARYRPALAYDRCRDGAGPLAVPIRVVPDPLRYGDGTPAFPARLPPRIACDLRDGAGPARVVAALVPAARTVTAASGDASGDAGWQSAVCAAGTVTVDVALAPDVRSDLDLYDVPLAGCDE